MTDDSLVKKFSDLESEIIQLKRKVTVVREAVGFLRTEIRFLMNNVFLQTINPDAVVCTWATADDFRAKYPAYLRHASGGLFDCPIGWVDIVDRCFTDLAQVGFTGIVTQVKEKFGGLRVYLGPVPPEIKEEVYKIITKAEEEAYEVCIECGMPGKKDGVYTLCDLHRPARPE